MNSINERFTKLLYLEDYTLLDGKAKILEVSQSERTAIYLDQTVFYPQGGGQPYDTGAITSVSGKFRVEEVRFVDGIVHHIGKFEDGTLSKDEQVNCIVDKERRVLNSRLHSAGHVVDYAVSKAKPGWIPFKGYHFPEGPYVEYQGNLNDEERESLRLKLQTICSDFIKQDIVPKLLFLDKEQMRSICRHVPDNMPDKKPQRVVVFGDFGVPCGGTHVSNLNSIATITIRNIKSKSGNIRVGYECK